MRRPCLGRPPFTGFFVFAFAMTIWLASTARIGEASAWPVEREWTEEEEAGFTQWFEKIAAKQWKSTNEMLHSREYNSLYDEQDRKMYYYCDCADLPYIMRAYYAYKRRLPFVGNYVSGGRYTKVGNHTSSVFDNLSFSGSTQDFFGALNGIHSGNFRTSPDSEDSFTYPIEITRERLRPGMAFYSPNGHVAMVAEVETDGSIHLVDAHPDQSVTRIAFGPKLEVRSRTYSGGFRGYRKVVVDGGKAKWLAENKDQPGFSLEQYDFKEYYGTLKMRLARVTVDPLDAFEKYIREDTYQEVLDRVASVDRGWAVGRVQEISIGSNIYDSTGQWEDLSSPSRDLRLRLSFMNIPEQVRYYMGQLRDDPGSLKTRIRDPFELGKAMLERKDRLFHDMTFEYTNSKGGKVRLSLEDLEKRLFLLSFDPNHSPELRWGATGEELKTASNDKKRYRAGYEQQQRWRNRMEKKQGDMAPDDDDNPREAPEHDLSRMIAATLESVAPGPAVSVAQAAKPSKAADKYITVKN